MHKPHRWDRESPPDPSLEFRTPLSVVSEQLQDAVIWAELPESYAALAVRAFREILDLASGRAAEPGAFDAAAAARWEEEVLGHSREVEDLWAALATIAREVAEPLFDHGQLALACMSIADWALAHAAPGAGLLFAEAAALACPDSARHAYVAGRLLQRYGMGCEAGRWLRRAHRLAIRAGDEHARVLSAGGLDEDGPPPPQDEPPPPEDEPPPPDDGPWWEPD